MNGFLQRMDPMLINAAGVTAVADPGSYVDAFGVTHRNYIWVKTLVLGGTDLTLTTPGTPTITVTAKSMAGYCIQCTAVSNIQYGGYFAGMLKYTIGPTPPANTRPVSVNSGTSISDPGSYVDAFGVTHRQYIWVITSGKKWFKCTGPATGDTTIRMQIPMTSGYPPLQCTSIPECPVGALAYYIE